MSSDAHNSTHSSSRKGYDGSEELYKIFSESLNLIKILLNRCTVYLNRSEKRILFTKADMLKWQNEIRILNGKSQQIGLATCTFKSHLNQVLSTFAKRKLRIDQLRRTLAETEANLSKKIQNKKIWLNELDRTADVNRKLLQVLARREAYVKSTSNILMIPSIRNALVSQAKEIKEMQNIGISEQRYVQTDKYDPGEDGERLVENSQKALAELLLERDTLRARRREELASLEKTLSDLTVNGDNAWNFIQIFRSTFMHIFEDHVACEQ
ncbi:hypothetical protein ACOME3_003589 [Neoechinorhynchus agilis]